MRSREDPAVPCSVDWPIRTFLAVLGPHFSLLFLKEAFFKILHDKGAYFVKLGLVVTRQTGHPWFSGEGH